MLQFQRLSQVCYICRSDCISKSRYKILRILKILRIQEFHLHWILLYALHNLKCIAMGFGFSCCRPRSGFIPITLFAKEQKANYTILFIFTQGCGFGTDSRSTWAFIHPVVSWRVASPSSSSFSKALKNPITTLCRPPLLRPLACSW